MSTHYAGLESAIQDRKMDLPRLRSDTEEKLRNAKNESEARRILERFIEGFGDGHLAIDWENPSSNRADAVNGDLCGRLGYNARLKPGLDLSGLTTFTPLETPAAARFFPGGLIRLPNQSVVGTIRIGLFSGHAFPEACREAAKTLRLSDQASCDDNCSNAVELQVANLLTAALRARAKELATAGATALLVDLTHNGGGSDWVEAAVRELSSVPLRDARFAFIKHPHWTENLKEELGDVQADLKKQKDSERLLTEAAETLTAAITQTQDVCNLTEVWETGKPSCSMLVKNKLFVSGILDYAKPGSFSALQSKSILFHPLRYSYSEEPDRLPLFVLVDRDTWSSAEYFAALLQDNHAATILGESTGGAGCGYTNGGISTRLKNSGAAIKMPDCVRFRSDGSDEVDGITPDLSVPWPRHGSDYQRAVMLLSVLGRLVPPAHAGPHAPKSN
jgi:hypothetical protein